LFQHIGNGGLLGGSLVPLPDLTLLRVELPELLVQLAPPCFQATGDLGKQLVSILDSRPDISRPVLKFALALKIKRVE
jgi:hypothetical protein